MPELPEVETIKNQLFPIIVGKTIINTFQSNLNLRKKPIPDLNILCNQIITNVFRRNKYIIIEMKNFYLFIHLGMTGQLLLEENLPNKKHIHAYFQFYNGFLYYQDARRFGSIQVYSKKDFPNFDEIPTISVLGFEPLSSEFTYNKLAQLILNNKSVAKKFIMDNHLICGIGNIYACEILFLSKIHPEVMMKDINHEQCELLFFNIKSVLKKAIQLGGSTISDFKHVNGESGKMQDFYFVYDREKENCKVCNTLIERIKQQGRSTFFCPYCQKK